MTYAIDTTKRKFTRLLDSLTNASSTSLPASRQNNNASTTTLQFNPETPTKKPRMSRPVSAAVRTSPRSSIDTMMQPYIAEKKPTPVKEGGDQKPPNFAPLDRGQFLARLKTFRHVDRWTTKPERVNEVEWAKCGWSCVGKERVGCVGGCDRELVIKLEREEDEERQDSGIDIDLEIEDDDWSASVSEQLVERYADMIVTAHDDYCLWRKRGCDATIYRLPLSYPATALEALRWRYDSLSVMNDLPTNLSTPAAVDICTIILELGPEFFQSPQSGLATPAGEPAPPPAINEQALIFALFGWQAEAGHISGLAVCEACFRRLGLWLFKSRSRSTIGSEAAVVEEEASMSRLDVIEEHRDYCPWINAASQNGGVTPTNRTPGLSELAGWEILARVIRNTAHLNGRSSQPPALPSTTVGDDSRGDVGSPADRAGQADAMALRDSKDRERWTKLRKLRQVFHIKDSKRLGKVKGNGTAQMPSTAG